jgi:hypothetical protein
LIHVKLRRFNPLKIQQSQKTLVERVVLILEKIELYFVVPPLPAPFSPESAETQSRPIAWNGKRGKAFRACHARSQLFS